MFQTNFYNSSIHAVRPPQMLSKSEKDEEWRCTNMDALEVIARQQFTDNIRLIENYEMVKGKFIFAHYFSQDDYVDLVSQLTKEFELPPYLRHYDIISQVINTLAGEWQARPDVFRVKAHDEGTTNEYIRKQTDLLLKYVTSKIEVEVRAKLLQEGLDPDKKDFKSQEEQQSYQQALDQARQALTPPQIQEYMKSDWFTAAEVWGQHQLELDRQRFKLAEKENREFQDMLISDRCFRHFYITANGYNQETWNPVNVFFHKSPDVEYIEEGDYVGRIFYLTTADIIDRYGHCMSKKQLDLLKGDIQKDKTKWNEAKGYDYVYKEYAVPFAGFPQWDMVRKSAPPSFKNVTDLDVGIPNLDQSFFSSLYGGKFYHEARGHFCVIEGYWKSQRKIGKVSYIDPNTGLLTKVFVDEDTILPDSFVEVDDYGISGDESNAVNTVTWTWVNEVWKGVKICTKNNRNVSEDIYLDVEPMEFQFKGDINIYGSKLPVCGQIFSVRNSQSMALVDLMKPHQIGHNVAMNQAYQEMQKDVGKFIVMDVNMFQDAKDWGGDAAAEKFMLMAKELGVAIADTSPQNSNTAAAVAGGHMPKELDMDASARILSRLKIAEAFEQFALKQIGFNEYRLGQQSASASATGIKQGQQSSFAQTETYFTNFSNYISRCNKMNIDIAQYVQSQEMDVTITYTKSDLSRAFIKMNGTELLLSDLHVYVSNSQEEIRQLETLRELAINNNTSGATMLTLAEIVTSNSPAQIKAKLKVAEDRQQALLDQQFQLQQKQLDAKNQIEILKLQVTKEDTDQTNQTRKEVAYIQTFSRQPDNTADKNADNEPDILEYERLSQQQNQAQNKDQLARDKQSLERDKAIADNEYKSKKLQLEEQKIRQQLDIQNKELEYARIMKGQEAPNK